MGKRILSLVLTFAMIMLVTVNVTSVYADDENVVGIEYYTDYNEETGELSGKVTSVNKNDYVYAAVTFSNFTKISTAQITVGFDTDKLELTSFTTNEPMVLSETKQLIGSDEDTHLDGTYGVIQLEIESPDYDYLSPQWNTVAYPAILKQENVGMAAFSWLASGAFDIVTEKLVIFKFKAVKIGEAAFGIMRKVNEGDIHYASNASGIKVTLDDIVKSYDDCTINMPSLVIAGQQLGRPDVNLADRVATWNAVEDAASYNVTVTVNGAPYIENYSTTDTSYTVPADVKYGDVTVSVVAVSGNTEVADSQAGIASEKLTMDLLAPATVKWEGTKLVWSAVEGAEGYRVTLKCRYGTGAYESVGYDDVMINATEVELGNEIIAPTEGRNSYVATVNAVGDNEYTFDGPAGTSGENNICGSVKKVTNPGWVDATCFAQWTPADDVANIAGYKLVLYKNNERADEISADKNASSKDLSSYMTEPGVYKYVIISLGATTADGTYTDSTGVESEPKTVSAKLNPVTSVTWNDRKLTWVDDNDINNVEVYKVALYKDGALAGEYEVYHSRELDFDTMLTKDGALVSIAAGNYHVEITAEGDGTVYETSDMFTSEPESFTERLAAPAGLAWNDTNENTAEWAAVTGAGTYEVKLYYNGVDTHVVVYTTSTNVDFTNVPDENNPGEFINHLIWNGDYTFGVKALANGSYSASIETIGTDVNQVTVAPVGNVYVDLYTDEECTTEATQIAVGDTVYAKISVENVPGFTTFALPFKFDSRLFDVVDAEGNPVPDGQINGNRLNDFSQGLKLCDAISRFNIVSADGYPYVKNTEGLVFVQGYNGSAISVSGKTDLVIIKLSAVGKSDGDTKLEFAVANDDGSPYEEGALPGFELSSDEQSVFPAYVAEEFPVEAGQLKKMQAPVWSGTSLTWVAPASKNITKYEIEIFKNGEPVGIYEADADATAKDMITVVGSDGSYTAKIRAIGDEGAGVLSSEWSDESAAYVKSSGGSGGGGGSYIPKEEKPDDEEPGTDEPGTDDKEPVEFTDIEGHWAEEDIKELAELKIIEGYGDGTYRPEWGITRAEFTKLMVMCMGAELITDGTVYDDTAEHWAKDYIATGTALNIVNGIGNNLFAPDEVITREQMAAIMYRIAAPEEEIAKADYNDYDSISEYAEKAVDYVTSEGIMIGFEDNTFRPTTKTNRAQTATVIVRLLKAGFFEALKK